MASLSKLAEALLLWSEAAARPGIMSLKGWQLRNAFAKDVSAYFKSLAASIDVQHDAANSYGAIEPHISHLLRDHHPMLLKSYLTHGTDAFMLSGTKSVFLEADGASFTLSAQGSQAKADELYAKIDRLGLTGKQAVDYLTVHGAELVKGLDAYTLKVMRVLIGNGIEQQLGVEGTARLIRTEFLDMSGARAKSIATTEMNDAMSEATLQKIHLVGSGGKRWIRSPGACPICTANSAQGVIPVDQPFQSGHQRPPGHPGRCRCAVGGGRLPA